MERHFMLILREHVFILILIEINIILRKLASGLPWLNIDNAASFEFRCSTPELVAACDNFGLRINTEKTVAMHQPPPNTIYTAAHINVNERGLESTRSPPQYKTQDTWRRTDKTGTAIYEANRIAAAKTKRATRKSPAPRTNTANAQALPTCPRCQCTFCVRIGLVGHLRTHCTNNPTIRTSMSNPANPPSDSPNLTPGINSITPTIIETTSQYSSPVTSTTAAAATTTTISDEDSFLTCGVVSEVDGSAHFPCYKKSDALEIITVR
ncbi:unnamed protein product [Schistocephalus solidus]|uniref:C2H2-type domain-containing protein n=1 Tax=Schistocephalus solidus TaxID=70667 RepID=A0A183SI63_SCHSO|nr:unnamed protein product [Schistocephalus solidus]